MTEHNDARPFYVTMTWDNFPEGGSFGEVIEAENHEAAEKACRESMAAARISEYDEAHMLQFAGADNPDESAIADILESYSSDWEVIDCLPLDDFVFGLISGQSSAWRAALVKRILAINAARV